MSTPDDPLPVDARMMTLLLSVVAALVALVTTILAFSGSNYLALHHRASLARYEAMTTPSQETSRYFVLGNDRAALHLFAALELNVTEVSISPLSGTATLHIVNSDAAVLDRLRALPSTKLVLNTSAALLCR